MPQESAVIPSEKEFNYPKVLFGERLWVVLSQTEDLVTGTVVTTEAIDIDQAGTLVKITTIFRDPRANITPLMNTIWIPDVFVDVEYDENGSIKSRRLVRYNELEELPLELTPEELADNNLLEEGTY